MPARNGKQYKHEIKEQINLLKEQIILLKEEYRFAPTAPDKTDKRYIAQCLMSSGKVPPKEGYHRHHWSYNTEDALDIFYLKGKNHYWAHCVLDYDKDSGYYYNKFSGELLDTKSKHIRALVERRKIDKKYRLMVG